LDVDAERVERMLVTIAGYARERKKLGGRLMIEVAPVTLDQAFVEKFPDVRPGPHALLTVHAYEARADAHGGVSPDVPAQTPGGPETVPASDYPGASIGTLQALVSECGGHLWMAVEPPGSMVLKIHLPRRALDEPGFPVPARARWISRLVRARH
jgi:hypothetical protein